MPRVPLRGQTLGASSVYFILCINSFCHKKLIGWLVEWLANWLTEWLIEYLILYFFHALYFKVFSKLFISSPTFCPLMLEQAYFYDFTFSSLVTALGWGQGLSIFPYFSEPGHSYSSVTLFYIVNCNRLGILNSLWFQSPVVYRQFFVFQRLTHGLYLSYGYSSLILL